MFTLIVIAFVFVVLPLVVVRAMWPDWRGSARAWAAGVVEPFFMPAQLVPVPKLQRRMLQRILTSVTITARGRTVVPAAVTISLSPEDHDRVEPVVNLLTEELKDATLAEGRKRGWTVPDSIDIDIVGDPTVNNGRPVIDRDSLVYPMEGVVVRSARAGTRLSRTKPMAGRTRAQSDLHAVPSSGPLPRTKPIIVTELIRVDQPGTIDLTDSERLHLGREEGDVIIDHDLVSASHADLRRVGGQWIVRDLDSTNGTFVNGQRIAGDVSLVHLDEISLAYDGARFMFSRLSPTNPL
jgi:hypothetical protein